MRRYSGTPILVVPSRVLVSRQYLLNVKWEATFEEASKEYQ